MEERTNYYKFELHYLHRLHRLSNNSEEWKGKGQPVESKTVKNVENFLAEFYEKHPKLPMPEVVYDPSGSIHVLWRGKAIYKVILKYGPGVSAFYDFSIKERESSGIFPVTSEHLHPFLDDVVTTLLVEAAR